MAIPSPPRDPSRSRYGAVFLLTLALLVFVIVAPAADWSRAVALLLESGALVVAAATSYGRSEALALSGLLAVAIPLSIVQGLVRLVRHAGATLQVVAGALSIYLLIGLMFAWMIGLVANVDGAPYFAGGSDATAGERVYYSLAVLTTTGFGDLTAAQPLGRALAEHGDLRESGGTG